MPHNSSTQISSTLEQQNANDSQRRGQILLDATIQFSNQRGKDDVAGADKYSKIFYSLIGDTNVQTRKLISSHLARNPYTPRPIAYYLAMEPVEIAGPFLLISPALWERDLIQLIDKVGPENLAVIARRSDINARVAQALVARGDKRSCLVLGRNPILKLNSINLTNGSDNSLPTPISGETFQKGEADLRDAKRELMEMASQSGKLGRNSTRPENPITLKAQQSTSIAKRLLAHAKSNKPEMVAREIAVEIHMSERNINKLVTHESSASLVVFLKGLHLSRTDTSQLLLLVNKRVGRNIAEFTSSMEQYDRFSISQCHDIMKNLGAKKLPEEREGSLQSSQQVSQMDDVIQARRRQISSNQAPPMFGALRKAG